MSSSVRNQPVDRREWPIIVPALWLCVSPWIWGEAAGLDDAATLNSWLVGTALIALAVWGAYKSAEWTDWVTLALGVWLVAAPWLLGFTSLDALRWSDIAVGFIVAGLAAWYLTSTDHRGPTRIA